MTNPKISVIVPVYNVEKYLSECLDSIVNQTLRDIEIICLNDGSTDNSLHILKEYASKDNRIKIIDKENEGLGYTRKVGLDVATGKYILFCDSDDYYAELTAFEELYNYIEKVKVDIVIFGFVQKNEINNSVDYISDYDKYPQKDIFSYLDIDNNIFSINVMTWLKIYSKKFLDSYDDWYFPKHTFYEDNPFHYQILLRAMCSYINKYFYVYRIRQNSIMTIKTNEKKLSDLFKIFSKVCFILKGKCKNIQFLNYFYNVLIFRSRDYLIKEVETVKYIIDIIKQFDISDLLEIGYRDEFFIFRASLRMTPENYLEYLNKRQIKNKNRQIKTLDNAVKDRDDVIKTLENAVKDRDDTIKTLDNAVKDRDDVIKTLENAVKDRDDTIKTLENAVKDKDDVIKTLENAVKDRDDTIKTLENAVKDKKNAIKNLHIIVNDRDRKINIQDQAIERLQKSWSYRIGRVLLFPLSVSLEFYRFIRDYNLIKNSGLFDVEYYLAQNEDVRKAKIDPIKHYLKFGWKQGRNPSAKFNNNEYLDKRPDVKANAICPLVHFIKFGKEKQ